MSEPKTYKMKDAEEYTVDVMQLAKNDGMTAHKDLEEHNRHIAAWLDENGASIESFGVDHITYRNSAGSPAWFAVAGDRIVKTSNLDKTRSRFYVVRIPDEEFRRAYLEVVDA